MKKTFLFNSKKRFWYFGHEFQVWIGFSSPYTLKARIFFLFCLFCCKFWVGWEEKENTAWEWELFDFRRKPGYEKKAWGAMREMKNLRTHSRGLDTRIISWGFGLMYHESVWGVPKQMRNKKKEKKIYFNFLRANFLKQIWIKGRVGRAMPIVVRGQTSEEKFSLLSTCRHWTKSKLKRKAFISKCPSPECRVLVNEKWADSWGVEEKHKIRETFFFRIQMKKKNPRDTQWSQLTWWIGWWMFMFWCGAMGWRYKCCW